jgi:putative membrane protein
VPEDHGQAGAALGWPIPGWLILAALILAAVLYLAAAASQTAAASRTRAGAWPAHRSVLWLLGLAAIATAALGPLADAARHDFAAHMAAHLLAGMLAPLLMALAAPVTLTLRVLDVAHARRVSRSLNSRPARFLTDPAPAAILNVGSLWALYATPFGGMLLGASSSHHLLLAHFFLAGYLFTAAIAGVDPAPHRRSFRLRLAVLALAIAAHSILAKHLYSHPPAGVPAAAAEDGALLMYYGGDLLHLALVVLLCARWYRASRPPALQRASRPG